MPKGNLQSLLDRRLVGIAAIVGSDPTFRGASLRLSLALFRLVG